MGRIVGAVVITLCVAGGAVAAPSLGPVDAKALQATVEGVVREFMLPGAVAVLSTPQGNFVFGYGATELGGTVPSAFSVDGMLPANTLMLKTLDKVYGTELLK